MVQVRCKNNGITKSFPEGTSLLDVWQEYADELHFDYPVVSAKVNNVSQGLKYRVYNNRDVEFIDVRDGSGRRVYARSLCFVLYKAVSDVFPGSRLFVEHPLSRGYYCNFRKKENELDSCIKNIGSWMETLVKIQSFDNENEISDEFYESNVKEKMLSI